MPTRASKPKRPRDVNQLAAHIVKLATGQITEAAAEPKNRKLAAAGKRGAKARRQKLTPQQRREIAKKAAVTRWAKRAG